MTVSLRYNMSYYCYMLYTNDNLKTYVGATIDPERRLRQHNKEISGGARATGISVQQGLTWQRACYITGIPEWRSALQIEWRWKQIGRTQYGTQPRITGLAHNGTEHDTAGAERAGRLRRHRRGLHHADDARWAARVVARA